MLVKSRANSTKFGRTRPVLTRIRRFGGEFGLTNFGRIRPIPARVRPSAYSHFTNVRVNSAKFGRIWSTPRMCFQSRSDLAELEPFVGRHRPKLAKFGPEGADIA